ncbi:TetR family transcriptional regulator [Alkalibaculum sp. M08DMB]|uniref:TetR family transcriptional regulator n=1 Tax=Alkalibaculum sporogenes TaxID=2655001 RepID=A0A6A7KC42_9FIRM|nr:TetR/AcrR family transcriptional regulator [Alkalibaculum sporogenes]MPW26966.1 TetR family transcriptional regulator [Alkalibaculum sporogenes]
MQTKRKIYEVSKKLFLETGYFKVTNKQIAEMANVTHGMIRYYFKKKENIALTMLRENYQIVSSFLLDFIDNNKDPFLFFITMDNLLNRIKNNDDKLRKFLIDISRENIDYNKTTPMNINPEYSENILKMMHTAGKYSETQYRVFVAVIFGAAHSLQYEMDRALDLTFDEFFNEMVHLYIYMLDLKCDEKRIQSYITQSKNLSEQVWNRYPQLMDTKNYLYMSEFPEKTIADNLLEL